MQKLWLAILSTLLLSAPMTAFTHPGLKDAKGCHTKDDGTGYHCHESEASAKTEENSQSQDNAAASPASKGGDDSETDVAGSVDTDGCDFDSIDGQLVKFHQPADLKKYGFQLWSEKPKLVGAGMAHEKLQGKKGKLLSEPLTHDSRGVEKTYYQVVLENCSKVYSSTLGSSDTGTALQDTMASRSVYYVLEDGMDAIVTLPHSRLRARDGACVRRSLPAADGKGYNVTIEVCMRIGAPKTLDDDKVPRIQVLVRGREHLVYGKAWQLIASRDGERLYKGRLGDNRPTLLDCSQHGCTHFTVSTPISGKKLTEGEYTFHFTYAQNTDRQHKLRIKLAPEKKTEEAASTQE